MINCDICGKSIENGDKAYATTTGLIKEECEGFVPDIDTPWLTVACSECGDRISEVIANISSKGCLYFQGLAYEIIKWYKTENGIDDPLDGDAVDKLILILKDKINQIEGNW